MATNNALNTSMPIEVADGGTGAATLTSHGVLLGNATSAVTATAEGETGKVLTGNTGAAPTWESAGTGDVVGPSSATDDAIAKYDTTTGKLIQDSNATIADDGDMTITGALLPIGDRAKHIGSATNSFDNLYIDGITFNDGTDIMDAYDEGTWTPTFFGTTTAGVNTYTSQDGYYTQIGNIVHACGRIVMSAKGTGGDAMAGNLACSLPITSLNNANMRWSGAMTDSNVNYDANYTTVAAILDPNTTNGILYECGNNQALNGVAVSQSSDTTQTIFDITYQTN